MKRPSALLGALLLSAGCSTHVDRLLPVRTAYFDGDVAAAQGKIDEGVKHAPREADVFQLDRATVLLTEGRAKEAELLLREVRDHFDHLEQKDAGELALSMLTDDQRLAYAGEDYEKVLIRAFLALANLMGDGQDAGAYALQVADKQGQLIQAGTAADGNNPKRAYKQVAVGAYLHAALREQTMQNYDDAARSLQQVCDWAPDFPAARRDLERVRTGRHSAPGNGVVYVFTLVGRGPFKEEHAEIPTQAALLIADRIISMAGKHNLPPTLAPVKVPRVVVPEGDVQGVLVNVDGRDLGPTETVTDVGKLAVQQSEALAPYVIARAVARRTIKKAAVFGAEEALRTQKNGWAELAFGAAGVIWEATESADTRCWGLLPEKIQVLRVELPAGTHQLSLQPLGALGSLRGRRQTAPVEVRNGRNTYVLAAFPTGQLAGRVVASK